jgi:hypothetical protein
MANKRNKRYFGMTVLQLSILGCLACVVLGSVGASFKFISGMLGNQGERTLETVVETSTSAAMATPLPRPTPSMTAAPTPIPYEALVPPGWKQYRDQTKGYEIWLPPEFEAREPRAQLEEIIRKYEEIGDTETAQYQRSIFEQSLERYVLWTIDSIPSPLQYQTTILLARDPLTAESLTKYIDEIVQNPSGSLALLERKPNPFGSLEAERLWFEGKEATTNFGEAYYVIRVGDTVWSIACATHINEFYIRLPVFDQVASTFRMLDPQ